MNIQKWEAFVTAADLGSFSRAAERLGYTQSGLTHMMKSLETELGFPLLLRGSFGVRPTEEGARLLPEVRHLLAVEGLLTEAVRRIREGEGGTLRIGVCPSAAAHLLPEILTLFHREFPHTTVEVTEGDTAALREGVTSGRLDLALVGSEQSDLSFTPLLEEPLLAVLPPDRSADVDSPLSLAALGGENLLLPELGAELDTEATLRAHGVATRVTPSRLDTATVISMVGHGLGVSLLPSLALRGVGGVRCLSTEPRLTRRIGMLQSPKKKQTEAIRRFLSISKKCAEALWEEE